MWSTIATYILPVAKPTIHGWERALHPPIQSGGHLAALVVLLYTAARLSFLLVLAHRTGSYKKGEQLSVFLRFHPFPMQATNCQATATGLFVAMLHKDLLCPHGPVISPRVQDPPSCAHRRQSVAILTNFHSLFRVGAFTENRCRSEGSLQIQPSLTSTFRRM